MATMNCHATNSTFRQLPGNGLNYRVPPFQRDYSWAEDEWYDLWQDILGSSSLAFEDSERRSVSTSKTLGVTKPLTYQQVRTGEFDDVP